MVEDRGQRRGLFVNREKVEGREASDGDAITFGIDDSYEIIFRSNSGGLKPRSRISSRASSTSPARSPRAAASSSFKRPAGSHFLLHSQLPLDVVLGHMLDHAVSVTDADRGLLLESTAAGALKVKLARRSGGLRLPPEASRPVRPPINLRSRSNRR